MTTIPTPQNVPPVLMPWPAEHYGCRVVELGEDGDTWAVGGQLRDQHVDDRRAVAAVLHHLRHDCSYSRADVRDLVGELRQVDRRWVTVVDDDDEPWQWCDWRTPGAWAVTYVETF